jgi:hypothetical protein
MDANEHLEALRRQLNEVFDETIDAGNISGASHYYSACLFDFSQQLEDSAISELIKSVAAQFESATLFAAFGLYRQAFSALRLALELGLGAIYFSVFRLDLSEWLDGRGDIKWSQLTDDDNGVLSHRFSNAFFPDLTSDVPGFSIRAKRLYRELSEFVHGNYETWKNEGLVISYSASASQRYQGKCKETFEVILFTLCCRYLRDLSEAKRDQLEFISEELGHLGPVRKIFGGPEDL